MTLWKPLSVILIVASLARGKTVDNKLTGQPKVSCGPNTISVVGESEKPFEGVVYIKNWRRTPGCFHPFQPNKPTTPEHQIPLTDLGLCGMEIRRNVEKQELEIFGVFVFSFHPMFVTVADRAFAVHCIFKQQDFSLGQGFDIKQMSTVGTLEGTASTPTISLTVVPGGVPDLAVPPAKTVKVGDPLVFIWHLPISSEVYGIKVGDCTAETLRGRGAKILEDGCSLDSVAVSDVSYSEDRSRAFATAMAFKFADEEDLWFKCSVSVCRKGSSSPNATSEEFCGPSSPVCTNKRGKRNVKDNYKKGVRRTLGDEMIQSRLFILDSYNQERQPRALKHKMKNITHYNPPTAPKPRWRLCMRKPVFALISSVVLLMYAVTFLLAAIGVITYWSRDRLKDGDTASTRAF